MSKSLIASACAALALASAHADSTKKEDPVQRTLHFSGAGPHTLEVRTIEGNISIEGYDGQDVLLTATRSTRAGSAADLEAAQREVTLEATEDAATVRAVVRYREGETCGEQIHHHDHDWPDYQVRYDFTIRVPRDTRLILCTINEGRVNVKGTRADFVVNSVNGPIEMTDVAGSGEATTVNGSVRGSFVATPRGKSLFRTINGSIVLSMPDAFAADLRMKTFNGGLYTDFDAVALDTALPIVAERKGSRTIYQSNAFALARVGRGGPEMTLDTLNGDVRVMRSAH